MITEKVQTNSEASVDHIQSVFDKQTKNQYNVANTTAKQRIKKLNRLLKSIQNHEAEIKAAMYNDFKKPEAEVDLTEIYVVIKEIKHARSHLRSWMRTRYVNTPLAFLGASSRIMYQPKGVVLIIAPWNYPFQLALAPLVSAIAAGNTVILKPSEHTPHTSAILKKIVEDVFEEDEAAVIEGAIDTSTELLKLPFNHIFFTGSPSIGKVVMKAAAKNLASVTLELGGKSPTIVDETANINLVIKRLLWGKFSNCGQICIAPDYVYVHESQKEKLLTALKIGLQGFYGNNIEESPDYPRIVNGSHVRRLKSYLEDTIEKGGKIEFGGTINEETDFVEPTLITDVPEDSAVMTEEIFGPLLPILTYSDLDKVISKINNGQKPLALYVYSTRKSNVKKILNSTRAGGSCINNSSVHFLNNDLPFGGNNNSGVGRSHGKSGFMAFTDERSVYQQHIPGALELIMPPYNNSFKKFITKFTVRWL